MQTEKSAGEKGGEVMLCSVFIPSERKSRMKRRHTPYSRKLFRKRERKRELRRKRDERYIREAEKLGISIVEIRRRKQKEFEKAGRKVGGKRIEKFVRPRTLGNII